ncbi:signal recognition particle-docking protein FtsY [Thalassorhabdomicrobium marinisediminis]|uniref:signal recognition particle-docking protein FtsY n=1 Tax=Thalassorhabdomicrobium marinisediminis TaxID=2170577 RepID=UPI0024918BE3|nr:signal recognition particle-docking protein FtsY [Thalassorhabdomicrobium marinisediminis]
MAFFKKLKDRMFKSSSKIEDGLDAIVNEGGTEDRIDPAAQPDGAGDAAGHARRAEAAAAADRAAQEQAEVLRQAEAEQQAETAAREAKARADAETAEAERHRAEQAAQAAAEAERAAQDQAASEAATRAAAEAAAAAQARAEDAARAREAEAAEAARRAEAARQAQAAREAEATRQQEAARQAEEARRAEEAAKPGLIGRLLGRSEGRGVVRRELDDDMLEQLEELLISADMGVDTALRVTANMAEGRFGKRLSTQEIKELLAGEVARIMEPVARPMPLYPTKPQVVLVVGVNGSGKTTTIGKLASQFQAAGKKVVIAAGDTFRAAAVEQLQVWGERAGVPVLTAPEGSDPASLAFDAMEQAARDGADLLMIDTAGRLQNRADLMEELSKIVRVIRKKDPDAPHNTLLVLDATTGQNAVSQVQTFQQLADVSGLVMTKLDGTAKGGVLVALADKFGLPIHAIGVGEQIDDLSPFDPEEFADALIGVTR